MVVDIRDIAKKAKVNFSTVSKALNNYPDVSAETRNRILKIAKKLNYNPNIIAQRLRTQKSYTIGVFIPFLYEGIGDSSGRVLEGIGKTANITYDYDVIIIGPQFGQGKSDSLRFFHKSQIDGAIVIRPAYYENRNLLNTFEKEKFPVVLAGASLKKLDYIRGDSIGGSIQAVEHLISLGRRRIGMLANSLPDLDHKERYDGYCSALIKNKIPYDEGLVVYTRAWVDEGYEGMKKLLPKKPDAVFTVSDYMAIGAMKAIREAGLRVPEDISIVGSDNIGQAADTTPPLTTVNYSSFEAGKEAVNMLMSRIEGKAKGRQVKILPGELIIRGSTVPKSS